MPHGIGNPLGGNSRQLQGIILARLTGRGERFLGDVFSSPPFAGNGFVVDERVRTECRIPIPSDRYGDVVVDTAKSMEVYREWLALTRPAPGPIPKPCPLRPVPMNKPRGEGASQM